MLARIQGNRVAPGFGALPREHRRLQMDAAFWPIVVIGSVVAYGAVILAGYWIFQRGYRGT